VQSIYAAWARGDFSSIDWAHPDIEFAFVGGPDADRSTGLSGMLEMFRDFLNAWTSYRIEGEEYRELDSGRVLVLTRSHARGKTSGMELTELGGSGANLFELRDGKVARLVLYWTRERAFADLGLAD
jgi:hypothetical protein